MRAETKAERPPRVIARLFPIGFGAVTLVSVVTYAVLLSLISDVAHLVVEMRQDEAPTRESLALAGTVREQALYQASWVISRDAQDLEDQHGRLAEIDRRVERLRPFISGDNTSRLEAISSDAHRLGTLFTTSLRPAAERGDDEALIEGARELRSLSARTSANADAIALAVAHKMAGAHVSATRSSRLGLLAAGGGVILVIALSITFTLSLWRAITRPLDILSAAARGFGSGDFSIRVGNIGEGELLAVARAFDRMAEELEVREKRLIESERMAVIGQLAAGVAHEINNPIGIIRGYLKTMEPDGDPEILKEELEILDEEAATCQRITQDLVTYARAPQLRRSPMGIRDLVEETLRRLAETNARTEVDHTIEVARLDADRGRLRQVLLNLLVNAAQAAGDGWRVSVIGRRVGDVYELSVSDRGPGVPEADRANVFEPFFTNRAGGTGLGLAISKSIVLAHGGTIEVRDRDGGGATFLVTLPLSPAEEGS